jgi:hypothetical protein
LASGQQLVDVEVEACDRTLTVIITQVYSIMYVNVFEGFVFVDNYTQVCVGWTLHLV